MDKAGAPEIPPAVKLRDYLEDAIELRSRLKGWRRDGEFIDSGGTLIYSVDVDIIVLYLRPGELAVPFKGRHGYTQIFRHDEKLTSCALADGVCDAIFFDQDGRAAATILLDVFESEFVGQYQRLLSLAQRMLEEARYLKRQPPNMAALKRELDEAQTGNSKYKVLKKHAPRIAKQYFTDSGAYTQLDRLNYLLNHSRLLKERQYRNDLREEWADALTIKPTIGLDFEQSRMINHVKAKLIEDNKDEDNAIVDAKAVARLAVLNRRLSHNNVRIIHITGDRKLVAAAEGLPAKADPAQWKNSADLNDLSFAEAFIRHPSSFLASSSIVFRDDRASDFQSGEGILGLLNMLVTEVEDKPKQSPLELLERCEKALADYPEALNSFESNWRKFVDPLLVKRVEEAERRLTFVGAPTFFTKLSEEIDFALEQRWMKLFSMALPSAFIFVDEEAKFGRDVPLVWFDCLFADDALRSIQDALLRRTVDRGQRAKIYKKAVSDLSRMKNYEYFSMLTFAALFGGNGRWETTLMLAEQAIAVAQPDGDVHLEETGITLPRSRAPAGGSELARTNISGREAHYLASIACKITAQSPADLARAEKHLAEAFDKLREDQRFLLETGQEWYLPYVTSSRFEAETLSLDTAKFLFARFPGEGRKAPLEFEKPILSSTEYRTKVDDLLQRVRHEPEAMIRSPLQQRLIINLLGRFLFDTEWQDEVERSPSERERLRRLLAEVTASGEAAGKANRGERPMTYLGSAVTSAARCMLDAQPSRAERKRREGDALNLFTDEEIKKHSFASFDAARYRELKRLCLSAGAS